MGPAYRVRFVQPTEEKRMAQDVLAGRHALVTGGAQGLGAGMATALAEAGARVMIGDVQDAAEVAEQIGGRATHLDVSDEASWEAAVAATVEQLGGLDILVTNAGIEISSRRRSRSPGSRATPPPSRRSTGSPASPRSRPASSASACASTASTRG